MLGNSPQPPFASVEKFTSVAEIESFVGFPLLHLPATTAPYPEVVTSLDVGVPSSDAGSVVATNPKIDWGVHITYIPTGDSVHSDSYSKILADGGVDIFIHPAPVGNAPPQIRLGQGINARMGNTARVTVKGSPGVAQRITVDRVQVAWTYMTPDGRDMQVIVMSGRTPDATLQLARSLVTTPFRSTTNPS
jgi:hypothetical protein